MSLQEIQDAINENTMAAPSPDTDIGHASLTVKTSHVTTANGSTYTDHVSPGTSPTNPNISTGSSVSTQSITTPTSGSTSTASHDSFVAQETIRQFAHEQ